MVEATLEDRIFPLKSQMGDSLHGHADLSLSFTGELLIAVPLRELLMEGA